MWERRVFYLIAVLCSLVFYFVYQQWLAWFLLAAILLLPLFSLVLSLPAMLKTKAFLHCPGVTRIGVPSRSSLRMESKLPAPPAVCKIRLENHLTGERYVGRAGELIPTEHCGKMTITPVKPGVYDYLGLFFRRLPMEKACTVMILPKPVPGELPRQGLRNNSGFRPKRGGGLAENHELRLFRPGDEVRNVHWKMSAKTGKLIYREALEPIRKGYVLTLCLSGTPAELDRKLGQLLWSCRELLRQKQSHEVRCMTGNGVLTFSVTNENTLEEMLFTLLSSPRAKGESMPEAADAFWQQRIGGDSDEG